VGKKGPRHSRKSRNSLLKYNYKSVKTDTKLSSKTSGSRISLEAFTSGGTRVRAKGMRGNNPYTQRVVRHTLLMYDCGVKQRILLSIFTVLNVYDIV